MTTVSASFVRTWARKRGHEVGTRGHLPQHVVEAFNKAHRTKQYINANPWLGEQRASEQPVPEPA